MKTVSYSEVLGWTEYDETAETLTAYSSTAYLTEAEVKRVSWLLSRPVESYESDFESDESASGFIFTTELRGVTADEFELLEEELDLRAPSLNNSAPRFLR